MNFTDPRFWLDLAQWLIVLALAGVTWLRKPGEQATAAVKALAEQVERERQALAMKIQALEDHVAHMPTDKEMETLRGDLQSIEAQLEGQRDLLKRVERQTSLIHEHLLNHRAK